MSKLAVVMIAVAIVIAGCGQTEKQDAHRTAGANVDRNAPDLVIAMPEDFGNVAIKCDRWGHRIYVTTNPGSHPSNVYVIDDPTCPGGAKK
jgi:hypothetical protein